VATATTDSLRLWNLELTTLVTRESSPELRSVTVLTPQSPSDGQQPRCGVTTCDGEHSYTGSCWIDPGFSNRASPSPRRSPRHSGADLRHRTPHSPIEAVIRHGLTKEGLPISTYESLDAAVATHGGVGPVFRHDTNPTATSDRLRERWQAGAHDITLTFSDDTPVPPPPGHSDR